MSSTIPLLKDLLDDIQDYTLSEKCEKRIRKGSEHLNDAMITSQLNFIIESNLWYGVRKACDCFDKKVVDNGIIWVKEINAKSANSGEKNFTFYYWIAYFGDNPTGYLIKECKPKSGENREWKILIENCDSDFIYHDVFDKDDSELEASIKIFIKKVKQAVSGDYYEEDEE
mmetsp:Transcript_1161/g.1476  ORF Transcript_1161/g.1476 Transcript_1161/m.1476 type:complete len:171 (+) Transcript_1161:133-645(+)|eukprot:CAMPEP_0178922530 /NCGR_PEP_ID=MMETSP0786-20121207/16206_1 /TAXON_ID=186022 /ORGANISM="Thalassionema frauenfeldii, Strain CCMP 1798" /LENGTH=170 /DNA_ID=CAMNT_0020596907 /DNA_START=100 /DNA_END=612 /DNA_ORIENTATION=-